MQQRRPVKYKKFIPAEWINPIAPKIGANVKAGTNCWTDFEFEGDFHQWGVSYEEFEGGPGNYTIAIVERFDGVIEEIIPSALQFTDKE